MIGQVNTLRTQERLAHLTPSVSPEQGGRKKAKITLQTFASSAQNDLLVYTHQLSPVHLHQQNEHQQISAWRHNARGFISKRFSPMKQTTKLVQQISRNSLQKTTSVKGQLKARLSHYETTQSSWQSNQKMESNDSLVDNLWSGISKIDDGSISLNAGRSSVCQRKTMVMRPFYLKLNSCKLAGDSRKDSVCKSSRSSQASPKVKRMQQMALPLQIKLPLLHQDFRLQSRLNLYRSKHSLSS